MATASRAPSSTNAKNLFTDQRYLAQNRVTESTPTAPYGRTTVKHRDHAI